MPMTHAEALALVEQAGITGPAHGDFAATKALLEAQPQLVEAMNALDQGQIDESPQGAAAHCHQREILEYLLSKGVALDLTMACALGRKATVEERLKADPGLARSTGAHVIPLLDHAADEATAAIIKRYSVA